MKMHAQINPRNQGFSLLEILIALTLLAIAGTFVMGKVFESLHEGKVDAAKIQMQGLAERLKEYRRHCYKYPDSLDALVASSGGDCKRFRPGGYIDGGQVPLDPWDHDFSYNSDGKNFDIVSFGVDGTQGGEGEDADISLYGTPTAGGGGGGNSSSKAADGEEASEEPAGNTEGGGE